MRWSVAIDWAYPRYLSISVIISIADANPSWCFHFYLHKALIWHLSRPNFILIYVLNMPMYASSASISFVELPYSFKPSIKSTVGQCRWDLSSVSRVRFVPVVTFIKSATKSLLLSKTTWHFRGLSLFIFILSVCIYHFPFAFITIVVKWESLRMWRLFCIFLRLVLATSDERCQKLFDTLYMPRRETYSVFCMPCYGAINHVLFFTDDCLLQPFCSSTITLDVCKCSYTLFAMMDVSNLYIVGRHVLGLYLLGSAVAFGVFDSK